MTTNLTCYERSHMFRNIVRIAPLAMAGYRWWQRRQQSQGPRQQGGNGQGGQASQHGQTGNDTSTR